MPRAFPLTDKTRMVIPLHCLRPFTFFLMSAEKPATQVSQIVHGVMAGMPIPFPLDNADACKDSGLTCPLQEGDHSYHYTMFVKTVYPKVRQ